MSPLYETKYRALLPPSAFSSKVVAAVESTAHAPVAGQAVTVTVSGSLAAMV